MIRIGIICPSEIAFRRFLPALFQCDEFEYVAVAIANEKEWFGEEAKSIPPNIRKSVLDEEREKAKKFQEEYGGSIVVGYEELITNSELDAVYIPLPPALHYMWARKALEMGKHVLVEKPATINESFTAGLIQLAKKKELALHENYMFVFHEQLKEIDEIVMSGRIGDFRIARIDFGFPRRKEGDFRYKKKMGGGALLDCGGYTLKYASMLLGDDVQIDCANLNYVNEFDVDLYGSATLSNKKGQTVQVSFGMDNQYKCDLEIWGSKGRLTSGRVLTAQAGFKPSCMLFMGNQQEKIDLSSDDTFLKSLKCFAKCMKNKSDRENAYEIIQKQASLVDEFLKVAKKNGES